MGSFERRKGQDIFCKAIRLLPPEVRQKASFLFVGKAADQEMMDAVRNLTADYPANVFYCKRLSRDEIKLGEPVTAGAVMVDGLGVGDVGNVVLRDRKHLSEDGLVIIVATVDSKSGKVLAGPDLVSRGFVYVRENESLMDGAQSIVENALQRCVDENVRDWNSVKTRVREALSSYIYRRTKRSPMILPILMEV